MIRWRGRNQERGQAEGFALPAAIVGLVVVGVLITGGIQLATQESRIGQATERGTQAFYLTESGMNTVFTTFSPANAGLQIWGTPATLSGTEGAGEWTSTVRRVDESLFFIQTTGTVATAGGGQASRTLGTMAKLFSVAINPPAALQTIGNVQISGQAQIRGEDLVPPTWNSQLCPNPLQNLPGVVTDGGRTVNTSGANATVSGSPQPHVEDPTLTADSFRQFGDATWEDLTALANIRLGPGSHNNMAPSYTGTGGCNLSDPYNWGEPLAPDDACGGYFPIIHISGNATIQSTARGQGILLVDGDLDLRGAFQFYGIVIVQGAFNVQGGGADGPRISGGVMSANAELDMTQSVVGGSIVQNSRCAVSRAIMSNDALNRLRPFTDRGWVDLTGAAF
jgi:hypothetical protein